MNLDSILSETLDAGTKGYPLSSPALKISDIGAQRWSLFAGDLPLPLAVIRDSALAHNHAWMRDFTASTGVLLSPHGKTTMAPQIFAQQLAAGAWGITVANVQQLGICVRFGVRRVIMANQLLGSAEVGVVIRLSSAHPDLEFHFLIDSLAQLASIENVAESQKLSRKLTALVELGVPGGRTGARTFDEALAVARAVAASKVVSLSGLECYEGLQVTGDSGRDEIVVADLMRRVQDVALACDREGTLRRVRRSFSPRAARLRSTSSPAICRCSSPSLYSRYLRSGCYVTHDSGFYNRMLEGVKARSGAAWQARSGLQAALEVWSRVQSCPEPGLAILTMGKRDASFDLEMPIASKRYRRGADTAPQPVPASWKIANMNDQHAYLRFSADADAAPQVGDLIGCGISHPCTTFDKWRALFTVDDDYRVTGAIRTFF